MKFFDLSGEHSNYKKFEITKENVLKNKGKIILYVNSRYYDRYRGYYSIDSGTLCDMKYSTLHLDNYGIQIDKRDILECVIKND